MNLKKDLASFLNKECKILEDLPIEEKEKLEPAIGENVESAVEIIGEYLYCE